MLWSTVTDSYAGSNFLDFFSCTFHAQTITFHSFSHTEELMLNYAVDKRENQEKK